MKLLVLFILIFVCLSCEEPKKESPDGFSNSSQKEMNLKEDSQVVGQKLAINKIQQEASKNKLIHKKTEFADKVLAAKSYIDSIQDENLTSLVNENDREVKAFKLSDLKNFLEFAKEYHPKFKVISPFQLEFTSNENKVFYALSKAMSRTSETQMKMLRDNEKMEKINIFNMIIKAVMAKAENRFEQNIIDIVRSKEYDLVIIDLLKARYNLFLAYGIKEFYYNSRGVAMDKIMKIIYGITWAKYGKLSLDTDLEKKNFAEQIEIIKNFKHASSLKKILEGEGEYENEHKSSKIQIEKLYEEFFKREHPSQNELIVLESLKELLN